MADSKPTYAAIRKRLSFALIISYAFDWIVLIAVGVIAVVLGRIEPNKRPFSLYDPDISYVFRLPSSSRGFTELYSHIASLLQKMRQYRHGCSSSLWPPSPSSASPSYP